MSHFSKKIGIGIFAITMCVCTSADAKPACDSWGSGYVIDSVIENGKTIKLTDGSIWRVQDRDVGTSALWNPGASIEVCDDNKLTNDVDGATIHVKHMQ